MVCLLLAWLRVVQAASAVWCPYCFWALRNRLLRACGAVLCRCGSVAGK
jgi:hypothetical protein